MRTEKEGNIIVCKDGERERERKKEKRDRKKDKERKILSLGKDLA